MTTPFILMTLACAIMALTISLQWRRIKQQEKLISDFNEKGFREVMGYGKVYRRRYIFVNIENAGDNGTLNSVAENYYDHGFDLDREKTTDRLLVFVKSEEVKEDWPMAKQEEQQTMEEYLLSQLDTPVVLKDGTMMTKPDGSPMTKQEAIATNILNLAMKGDVKAAQYIQNIQMRAKIMKKK